MFRKRLKNEAGYSLVEVMVSIIILAIAILPMVGMFDMGINSATKGGKYDKARALANLKMEEAKSLTYATQSGTTFRQAGNGDSLQRHRATWIRWAQRLTRLRVQGREAVHDRARPGSDPILSLSTRPWYGHRPDQGDRNRPVGPSGNTYTTYGLVGQGQ